MKKRPWLGIVFVLTAWSAASCSTQLGPKDGLDLLPHDWDRVKVGQEAPDFTLEDMDGRSVTLSSFRGKQLVILVFYRGHW